jgi:hypothetical protein
MEEFGELVYYAKNVLASDAEVRGKRGKQVEVDEFGELAEEEFGELPEEWSRSRAPQGAP